MSKKKTFHNFYLCELPPCDISGYMIKQLDSRGKVIFETMAPLESIDWFQDKDYKIISRDEWEEL